MTTSPSDAMPDPCSVAETDESARRSYARIWHAAARVFNLYSQGVMSGPYFVGAIRDLGRELVDCPPPDGDK